MVTAGTAASVSFSSSRSNSSRVRPVEDKKNYFLQVTSKKLQVTNLQVTNLQATNLQVSNLQGTNLEDTNLQISNILEIIRTFFHNLT